MAEKMSMLVVKVDLDCHKCYNKMRKILCKLQDRERITTISFDGKSKTVAIAGPFDPHRLICKIRCRGGKTVKEIQIIDVGGGGGNDNGKPPPNMAEAPSPPVSNGNKKKKNKKEKHPAAAEPPPPPHPSPPEPAPAPPPEMPPSPPPQPGTPDRGMAATMPVFHEEVDNPKAQPAQLEPPPPPSPKGMNNPPPGDYYMQPPATMMKPMPPPCPKPPPEPQYTVECVIPTVEIPSWPAAAPCGCPCCAPCFQGYYEGCRCGCGGRVYGCAAAGPRPWCGYQQGCRIITEEDPNAACSIM